MAIVDVRKNAISKAVSRENAYRKSQGQSEMTPIVVMAWGHILMKAPEEIYQRIIDSPTLIRDYVTKEMNKSF